VVFGGLLLFIEFVVNIFVLTSIFYQSMAPSIDVQSDGGYDETDAGEDSQSQEFLKDLILTPPDAGDKSGVDDEVAVPLKRSLANSFNSVAKRQGCKRVKKIKLEKD
jgi:hypothetical protein